MAAKEEFTNIVPKRKWKFGDLVIKSEKLKDLFEKGWELNIQYKGSIDVKIDADGKIILNLKKEILKRGIKKKDYYENAKE